MACSMALLLKLCPMVLFSRESIWIIKRMDKENLFQKAKLLSKIISMDRNLTHAAAIYFEWLNIYISFLNSSKIYLNLT